MAEKFMPYDPAEALDSLDTIAIFLVDAFETGDASHIAAAFNVVARAKDMETLAERVGLSRDQLHQTLGDVENLTLKTALAILGTVGLALTVAPASIGDATSGAPADDDADLAVQPSA
ncbi:MAG: addiction module antidote protein [Pseudomonadota bacterium]